MFKPSGKRRDPWTVTGALLAVQLLFGVHYVVAKWIVSEVSPAAWALLRVLCAFGVLLVIALIRYRGRPPLPGPRQLGWLALCAFFGVILNQALFLEGIARTNASHAAIMNAQIPSFALLAAVLMGQERFTGRKVGSLLLGLAGVLVLLGAERFRFDSATLGGDLLNLANAASYGVFIALGRRVMHKEDSLISTLLLFFFASIGLCFYGMDNLTGTELETLSGKVVGGMVFAVLGATVLTYFLNIWAVRRTQASHVALYIFLQPVVAALLGICLLGEAIGTRLLVAMALVLAALSLRDGGATDPLAMRDSTRA